MAMVDTCVQSIMAMHYYQATMLVIAISYSLLSFIVTMAMVVMGDMGVQTITAIQ